MVLNWNGRESDFTKRSIFSTIFVFCSVVALRCTPTEKFYWTKENDYKTQWMTKIMGTVSVSFTHCDCGRAVAAVHLHPRRTTWRRKC